MQASPVEGQSLQPKEKKKRKKEGEKKIPKRRRSLSCQNFDFCACPSLNVVKRDLGGKKGKLLCCKLIFDRIKANLAEIQPENHQNVQKTHFLQKAPGINGLSKMRLCHSFLHRSWLVASQVVERHLNHSWTFHARYSNFYSLQ